MPNNHQPRQRSDHRKGRRPVALTVLLRLLQTIGTLLLVVVITAGLFCCYGAIYVKTVVMPIAKQTDLSIYTMDENSVIYYYDENDNPVELATLSGDESREVVTYNQIPQDLIDAFVAIEDKRFWQHQGVDWYRTGSAVVNMFLSMRNTFGGSSITQQLVKNTTEYDDGTVKRKVVEIFTALELERDYDKKDIISWYLNEIYLGNRCYGVQTAAKFYFGKDVSELTLAECASLAGITNNPSLYSPNAQLSVARYTCANCEADVSLDPNVPCDTCGAVDYHEPEIWSGREYNKWRQELILAQMASDKISPDGAYITQEEYEAAVAEELVFAWDKEPEEIEQDEPETVAVSDVHSWYVDAVITEVISDLMENFGYSQKAATQMVYSGGLRIYVPYDPDVQEKVDQIYTNRENLDRVSKTGQKMSSGITVIDNSTGYVVAMAGDIGEKTVNRAWNNAMATRQPGSSIKPLAVYAPALEMGLITPASISDDNPRLLNERVWPANAPYEYRGLTTIQSAVVRSVNTIAVNVLEQVTPRLSYEFMTQKFGVTSLVEKQVVGNTVVSDVDGLAALSMGGLTKGMSTFEMAAAYATFPRNGAHTEATTYLLVKDINGDTLINNKPKTEFVIKESTAYYINTMLTAAVTGGTGTGARINGQTVAGKTGTTNDVYDLWFAGYTPYYTAAVWTGYPVNENMGNIANPAVSLWQKVMSLLHEGKEGIGFYEPDDLQNVTICMDCGKLATEDCGRDLRGNRTQTFRLMKDDMPSDQCSCHVPVVICTESPVLDANGKETGAYHLVAEFCPEECRKEVTMVDYFRNVVSDKVNVKDQYVLLTQYNQMDDPYCSVHIPAPEPEPEPEPSDQPQDPWDSPEPSAPENDQTEEPDTEPTGSVPPMQDSSEPPV